MAPGDTRRRWNPWPSVRFKACAPALVCLLLMLFPLIAAAQNQAPVMNPIGSQSVDEGANLNFGISASDPDATTPTLMAENMPLNATFVDNANGTGTFDFNPDFTQSGPYNVRFIASDGALADTEIVAITVNNINLAPVLAGIGAQVVDEGANLNFGISASDPDATTPALTAEDVPINATFTDTANGTGTFDFNPDFTQSGPYNVRFIASDGVLADTEIVAITVNNINLAPVLAGIGAQVVDEGANLNFGVSASDADGTIPALTAEDIPINATFTDNANGTGTFDFNPDFTQSGPYNVRFIASDGVLADTEIVAITVNNVNLAPVLAGIGSQSVDEGANLNFGVSATDADGTIPALT
ncbi:MAG: Ig-like domain-containing protein, partial [Candidatus Zixiibacteriota bacterium]